MTKGGTGKNSK